MSGYRNADGSESVGHVSEEGSQSLLGITAAVAITAKRVFRVSVVVAGSANGTINDVATTGAAAAANQIGTLAQVLGTTVYNWPIATKLVIVPGTGQTISVSYA